VRSRCCATSSTSGLPWFSTVSAFKISELTLHVDDRAQDLRDLADGVLGYDRSFRRFGGARLRQGLGATKESLKSLPEFKYNI
jgi:hypothetical protein